MKVGLSWMYLRYFYSRISKGLDYVLISNVFGTSLYFVKIRYYSVNG